ncbi:MAG TPA: putative Ig domain-containing protein [Verrucomicrobiae bacterium]|nr:putative Ig domain-containing protein [Verrucomicrobiae bacterium]
MKTFGFTFARARPAARVAAFIVSGFLAAASVCNAADQPEILTPKAPPTPRINGPSIFGVWPGSPFLYYIPATGERPMQFSVKGLPRGLKVDGKTGQITGTIKKAITW